MLRCILYVQDKTEPTAIRSETNYRKCVYKCIIIIIIIIINACFFLFPKRRRRFLRNKTINCWPILCKFYICTNINIIIILVAIIQCFWYTVKGGVNSCVFHSDRRGIFKFLYNQKLKGPIRYCTFNKILLK